MDKQRNKYKIIVDVHTSPNEAVEKVKNICKSGKGVIK
jgi:hypothetical protein